MRDFGPVVHAHQDRIIARSVAAARAVDATVAGVWADLMAVLTRQQGRTASAIHADAVRVLSGLQQIIPAVRAVMTDTVKDTVQAIVRNVQLNTSLVITEAKKFQKPNPQKVAELVQGVGWEQRVAALTRMADPVALGQALRAGIEAGETPTQLAKRIRPVVGNVAHVARRVARYETVRVAHELEFESYEGMGAELVVGYQVHSALAETTRPEHRRRHLTMYFREARPGEKGMDEMPRPPLEADGSVAWNCLCYLTPILNDGSRDPSPAVLPSTALTLDDGSNRPDYADLKPSLAPVQTGTASDVTAAVKAGGREIFRGVEDAGKARAFARGLDYVGGGDYGQGRYFGSEFTANRYTAEGGGGGVIRAAIKPGARTIHARDLDRMMQQAESAGNIPVGLDYGVYARAHGFDVITTDGDYVNVVNPAVLIVQRRLRSVPK